MSKYLYTVGDRTQTLQEWGEEIGVKWKTLWARINKGMPPENAIVREIERKTPQRNMNKVVEKICNGCGNKFLIPKCRDWREKSCSSECKIKVRQRKTSLLNESRKRCCIHCGTEFIAKISQIKSDQGKFCSLQCSFDGQVRYFIHSASSREKARNTLTDGYRTGRLVRASGEDNPQWMGGPVATTRRRTESGKAAQALRRYRKMNPEKVREFAIRRKNRILKKLPAGTIKKIGEAQRWKCAICCISVKNGYHVDHIMPLKLGGQHEPFNIQILCQKCNVRKNAKHPIQYMQEQGFLL